MFDAYLNKVFVGFRTNGIGSSVVLFFHIESDTDILARFMIKFLVQRVECRLRILDYFLESMKVLHVDLHAGSDRLEKDVF